ncbi:ChaN family lipoprotein [Sphaerothrix gracilis]|uniref:ChaN family lipoprotein n=1 Tax=Sphaerothrix gracilis TaxID=3151835 RepID=UPI0031FC07C2
MTGAGSLAGPLKGCLALVILLWGLAVAPPPAIAQGLPFLFEAGAAVETPAGAAYGPAALMSELAAADVVYLGETHTRAADHLAELAILQALYAEQPRLAIALEMFQQPFQPVIDRYLAGEIDEITLRQQSEYESRWGYPWAYYAPILRFARSHEIPVIALTAPAEATERVSRKGPQALQPADERYIPPVAEWMIGPPDYRQFMLRIYKDIHQGLGVGQGFDRFFAVQILWDETMAAAIARLHQASDRPVLVIAGQGHVIYDFGIPSRVQRRLGPTVAQQTVLLNPVEAFEIETAQPIGDFLWRSPMMAELEE